MAFRQMTGNRAAVERLQSMVSSGRLPSSLLFSGPKGSGKLDAALNLAKAVNCAQAPPGSNDACDRCSVCSRIDQGTYPDVRRVEPEGPGGQIKADSVRDVVNESPFRPFEGRKRVYIFEPADRMNPTSANTLLKTLEEPRPSTMLILITANEAAILPTLLSRCQRIRFLPLLPEEIADRLIREHEVPPHQARLAAALSGGNMTHALAVANQADKIEALRAEAVRIAMVPARGIGRAELTSRADRLAREGELAEVLRLTLSLVRDLASVGSGGSALYHPVTGELETLARQVPIQTWLQAYTKLEESLQDISVRYLNKRITLEQLLVGLDHLTERKTPTRTGDSGRSSAR